MPLTPHQFDQFESWLRQHFPDPGGLRCPLCAGDDWETGEIIMGLWVDPSGTPQVEGPYNPMLQVRCTRCRQVLLFDAGLMGLTTR